MPKLRTTIDALGTRPKLEALQAAVRREAEGTEADPFDEALIEAVAGVADALKTEAEALVRLEAGFKKVARRVVVSE